MREPVQPRPRARRATHVAVVCVTVAAVAALLLPVPAIAGEPIPPYATESGILATTPSADEGALGATFNPAQWGLMTRNETALWWSDRGVRPNAVNNWGFASGRILGFSARRHDFLLEGRLRQVTDHQIGLGGGTRAGAFGVAYGWSGGDAALVGRSHFVTAGAIARPTPWLSAGLAGRWALGNPAAEGALDVAVRPLSDPRLLVFADYALARRQTLDQGALSGGVALRPIPGLQAAFKLREGGNFQVSLGATLRRFGGQAVPGYASGGHLQGTNYVVRANPQLRGFDLDGQMNRGRRMAQMSLKGNLVYQKYRFGDEGSLGLREVTEKIRFARQDPTVGGLALDLSGLSGNVAMLWEVRRSIEALRATGKKVVVFCDNLDLATYYLASVADRIVMDPEGTMIAPGLQLSRTYMKDMLAKMGVGFDEWRFFKYKSAMEGFSRDRMSDADREQRQALLDDFYDELARGITAGGRMTRAAFDSTVNERPLLRADELLARGWVDQLGHSEDMKSAAKKLLGGRTSVRSIASLERLRREPDETWGAPPAVAVVYALGECAMDTGIRGRATSKALRGFRRSPDVKAVVLRADSPGGDGMASDQLASEMKELRKARKPILVSQGRVAASGGYWISMEADSIAVSPFTITGSIGVIGGWFWNEGLGKKLGLTSDRVQVGQSADLLGGLTLPLLGATIPERNLSEREHELMKETILGSYDDFTRRVAAARKLDLAYVREIGEGHVYSGRVGIEKRIVDRVASLEETIESAKRAAGIAPGREVRVVEYPRPPLFRMPSFVPSFVRARLERMVALAGGHAADDPLARFFPRTYEGRGLEFVFRNPGRPLFQVPGSLLPDEEPVAH